jgi:large subunit ribosomal protein L23
MTCYDVVHSSVRTEKGAAMEKNRKYIFQVARQSNKTEVKKSIEEIYKVKVQDVNINIVPAKLKRVRKEQGYTTPWKKAIVTLVDGHKIEMT